VSFVHLQVMSAYSLLSSTISISSLVKQAQKLSYSALALTDRNVLYGAIPFYKECMAHGIKPIIGLMIDVESVLEEDKAFPLVLLAQNNEGYKNLIKLSSAYGTKGVSGVRLKWLQAYRDGIIAITPGMEGEIEQCLLQGDQEGAIKVAATFRRIFPQFYLALQHLNKKEERTLVPQIKELAHSLTIPLVATNDVRYLTKEDAFTYECLVAIKEGRMIKEDERLEDTNHYLKSKKEMVELFQDEVDALEQSVLIAQKCHVELSFDQPHLPKYPLPSNQTASTFLRTLCEQGLNDRYSEVTEKHRARLNYELQVIEQMGFADYFLIVWDFMKFARKKGILTGPGRGSAAGSLVAYVLHITDVDPLKYGLLFERFLNPERITMPDIDIDFPDHRREEIINYVVQKYGSMHVAQIITFGTFGAKAVIRDLGKVFGFQNREIDQLSKMIPSRTGITLKEAYQESVPLQQFVQSSPVHQTFFQTAVKLEGLPRHTSTHAAGVVITDEPLTDIVPIQRGQQDFYLTQYSMDVLETLGVLKMDFLGLRNLSIIEHILHMIQKEQGVRIDIRSIPLDDEKTYQLLSRGDTLGIFQLESEGMRRVLRELRPTHFEDIVAVNSLYRPGPMEQIPLYIQRKHGRQAVPSIHPDIDQILHTTYGVIVYQEQIMEIAAEMAGFSLGEADLLRRAVSKKKKEVLDRKRSHFVEGALAKGYDQATATSVYDLIVRFANYGFNRSHAVAYSLIAYQMAYLKTHYPLAFYAALLSSVIGHDQKISQYVIEAKQKGLTILPPSVNNSHYVFQVENNGIRFSLAAIKGIGGAVWKEIARSRQQRPFEDLFDFCLRVSLKTINRSVLESLVLSGSFDDFGKDRATLLATIDVALEHAELVKPDDHFTLFQDDESLFLKPKYVEVEPMSLDDKLKAEKEVLGIYLTAHPVSPYISLFQRLGATTIFHVSEGSDVRLGVYISDQKTIRTKKGDVMAFVQLSDETGEIEGVLFPNVYRQYASLCQKGKVVFVKGKVWDRQRKKQLIIQQMYNLEEAKQMESDLKKGLYIKIEKQRNEQADWLQIKNIIENYPGTFPVYIYHEKNGKIIQLSKKEWVSYSNDCLLQLKNLLGEKNVVFRK
jgi:DNA polymerase III subunit alpha